jgi:hypothetical protein
MMPKRFNEADFVTEYTRVFKAGGTVADLASALGVTNAIVHGRTFSLRQRGFRLPQLRKSRNSTMIRAAKPVQVAEPTLGDELYFDTAFLHKPVEVKVHPAQPITLTFHITVSQDGSAA